jgi:hypothetical protein
MSYLHTRRESDAAWRLAERHGRGGYTDGLPWVTVDGETTYGQPGETLADLVEAHDHRARVVTLPAPGLPALTEGERA